MTVVSISGISNLTQNNTVPCPTQVQPSTGIQLLYEVKLIRKKGGVELRTWNNTIMYTDLAGMKDQLKECFGDMSPDFALGYIEPGHGTKGRQIPLKDDNDLATMYTAHRLKKKIVLWIKEELPRVTVPKKRSQLTIDVDEDLAVPGSSKHTGPSKYTKQIQKMNELEDIVDQLSEKHGEDFTPEQVRTWAHMIQMKKHISYENPPDKPFFKRPKPRMESGQKLAPESLSPGRRIQYRSQCIDQLDKWHSLMERGAISLDEYTDMQRSILSDIQKF